LGGFFGSLKVMVWLAISDVPLFAVSLTVSV
jgi:hypothetical protein